MWSFSFIELIGALSGSSETSATTTINVIHPRAIMSSATTTDITIMSPNRGQFASNVSVIDDPVVTETMCTDQTVDDEGIDAWYYVVLA